MFCFVCLIPETNPSKECGFRLNCLGWERTSITCLVDELVPKQLSGVRKFTGQDGLGPASLGVERHFSWKIGWVGHSDYLRGFTKFLDPQFKGT